MLAVLHIGQIRGASGQAEKQRQSRPARYDHDSVERVGLGLRLFTMRCKIQCDLLAKGNIPLPPGSAFFSTVSKEALPLTVITLYKSTGRRRNPCRRTMRLGTAQRRVGLQMRFHEPLGTSPPRLGSNLEQEVRGRRDYMDPPDRAVQKRGGRESSRPLLLSAIGGAEISAYFS
jgi:hypothetical protein